MIGHVKHTDCSNFLNQRLDSLTRSRSSAPYLLPARVGIAVALHPSNQLVGSPSSSAANPVRVRLCAPPQRSCCLVLNA